MSFWNHFGFQPSPIDSLLEKPDVTLEQLMDEPDLIQECKSQNRKLIEFCVQKSTLEKIVNFVVEIPPDDAPPERKEKYPTLCTDILCAEVWQFSDAVYGNTDLLKKLYSFFEIDPDTMTESQVKVANNCAKCITSLLHRKSAETLKFLRSYEDIAKRFVEHVCNPSILDYILRLIGDDDTHMMDDALGEGQPINEDASTVGWLCEQKFIDLLIDKFVTSDKEETQQCIGLMLFELASNLSSESAIIARLESIEMVDKMFTFITKPETIANHRSVSLCGFSTLIELLRKQRVQTYTDEDDPSKLPSLVVAVSGHLKECKEFLINAPLMPPMDTTFGRLDPPLGLARQSVLELVESLALTNSAFVFKSLYESRFMETAIDLFFKYPWNNFAHQSVFNIIATVLPQPYKELSEHIVRDCRLIDRILEAEEQNKREVEEHRAALGYIGHLTKISSLINSLAERENQNDHPDGLFASEVDKHCPQWSEYSSEILKDRSERESITLGGCRTGMSGMYDLGDSYAQEDSDSDDGDGEVVIGDGDDVLDDDVDDEEPEDPEEAYDDDEDGDNEFLDDHDREQVQEPPDYDDDEYDEVRIVSGEDLKAAEEETPAEAPEDVVAGEKPAPEDVVAEDKPSETPEDVVVEEKPSETPADVVEEKPTTPEEKNDAPEEVKEVKEEQPPEDKKDVAPEEP